MSLVTPAPLPELTTAPAPRVAIGISALSKSFLVRRGWVETLRSPFKGQRTPALSDVTLEIREGEFFGLLGPNGAGKTTLFKILSTLILPDSGQVVAGGFDVTRDATRVREFLAPVIPEERSLNWRLSAFENLFVFGALQGLKGQELRQRTQEVLERVELTGTGSKLVGTFSSGMKQRLLLARALLGRPRILLLDEPTRALDPISARRFRRFLREELAGKQAITVLLATHSAEEAIELCDRVGVLHNGRLLRTGSPDRLIEEYRDKDYRIWIPSTDWTRFVTAVRRDLDQDPARGEAETPEWVVGQIRVHGGPERVAALIREFILGGIRISRVEPVQLSLADLIERIVEHAP